MTKDQALKMNELTRKIASSYMEFGDNVDDPFYKFSPSELAEFVDSIVRDCACVPTDMWGEGQLPADQASKVQRRILTQFGVE